MAPDSDRDLRRLMKRYGIRVVPANPDEWPSLHKNTFNEIHKIKYQQFESYCTGDSTTERDSLRKQAKYRAEFLSKRARSLVRQRRNEAGWRFALENEVLRSFLSEPVCLKCRAHVSEAAIKTRIGSVDRSAESEEDRELCTCFSNHPHGANYAPSMNSIFDDRVQELVMHDPLVRSELPKKEPDRVVGLQVTKELKCDYRSARGKVRCCPSNDYADPLLFPFLILEAKSEKSANGFSDIEAQTAFPIWALLKLQEGLQDKVPEDTSRAGPLVWFLANRGEYWRLYGCYIKIDEPKRYEIVQLWDGCITERDRALQLLLIMDYVHKWAKDIYRPSIIGQLKSFASFKPNTRVSSGNEYDLHSLRKRVEKLQPVPRTLHYQSSPSSKLSLSPQCEAVDRCGSTLSGSFPHTRRGSLRSASIWESKIHGLRLTELNLPDVLEPAQGTNQDKHKWQQAIDKTAKLWERSEELLLVSGEDIEYMEVVFGGTDTRSDQLHPQATSFYVMAEFASFMDTNTWTITKEITYLAISERALKLLLATRKSTPQFRTRPCNSSIWRSAIDCLSLGTPRQNLSAAVACTLSEFRPYPKWNDANGSVNCGAIGYHPIARQQVRTVVETFRNLGKSRARPKSPRVFEYPTEEILDEFVRIPRRSVSPNARTFDVTTISSRVQTASKEREHINLVCKTCKEQSLSGRHFDRNVPVISDYGLVLVEALDATDEQKTTHSFCAFTFDLASEITDTSALLVAVEDLVESGSMYHTIKHPLPERFMPNVLEGDMIWNLPLSYRPLFSKQRFDAQNWLLELQGGNAQNPEENQFKSDYWHCLQVLLYFLKQKDMTYDDANKFTRIAVRCAKSEYRTCFYKTIQCSLKKEAENSYMWEHLGSVREHLLRAEGSCSNPIIVT